MTSSRTPQYALSNTNVAYNRDPSGNWYVSGSTRTSPFAGIERVFVRVLKMYPQSYLFVIQSVINGETAVALNILAQITASKSTDHK